ncbi:MAG: 16S rRNA (cytosine(967)-C(5))-methyltransferase RsmB [Clostridiaceae bacterium]|nr:16S rRNA (cytosine(967)-C(5))-methyltransferase RsmB [Clostridiaceae bacterium]
MNNPKQAKTVNIRKVALDVFLEIMEDNVFCDQALHHAFEVYTLEKRDRSFLMRLVEGTVERCLEMDYIIGCFSKLPVSKMKPVIRGILRLSVYQLFYMDQVPDAAVCNEAVKLAEKRKLHNLKGFVNGVLRGIIRGKETISYPDREQDPSAYLQLRYSMPEWIVTDLTEQYGVERTERIFAAFFKKQGNVTVRCMLSKCSAAQLTDSLRQQGVAVRSGALFPFALQLGQFDTLTQLRAFQDGLFQVQDESSMLAGVAAQIKPGDMVLDICSAPGGKAMHAADLLAGTGQVTAADLTQKKLDKIKENCGRLGLKNVQVVRNDATVFREEWRGMADVLLADLPCSGLGVMGHKCDIKYKTSRRDVEELARLQRNILSAAVHYLKPGGRLVYSTCTIHRLENERNAEWLEQEMGLCPVSIEQVLPDRLRGLTGEKGYLQLLPDMAGTDGFFVSCFQKRNAE